MGGVDGVMYGKVVQDQFVRAVNWPLGSLMSLVMLAGMLVLMLAFGRMLPQMNVGDG